MKVLIATKNQGKIEGAKRALDLFFDNFEIQGIPVPSDVSEQPVNEETYNGAKNRVKNLKRYAIENGVEADLFMAIESGIVNLYGNWEIINFAVIEDNKDFESCGVSPGFPVPKNLVEEIISTDLGKVMDRVFTEDKERGNKGGGIQLLTHGNVLRIDITQLAFIMALTRYVNGELWA